jgi:mycothiol synthase
MAFPSEHPDTDWFLAWEAGRLVGYASLYVARGNAHTGSTIHCRGVVHPQWRRQGLGRQLLDTAHRRAVEILASINEGKVTLQCLARDVEEDRQVMFEGFGMTVVRYFVNLARPIDNGLPPVHMPAGFRLRTFDPQHDLKTLWRIDNSAFRDHWGHTDSKLEDIAHWMEAPHLRPELWFLAVEEATGEAVGLGLNIIDPDWIAYTGRQEGYVDTLAVLREHRRRGLGTALLVHSLHALRQAGMNAAHLHADAENLTGAMRLYERVGFRVRKTDIAYEKTLRA